MARADLRHSGPLLGGLLLLGVAFAAILLRSTPPRPLAAGATTHEFSAARASQVLSTLVGDGVPHPVGSEANARVRDRVVQAFRAAGYETEIQRSFTCGPSAACADVHNVIAQRPGHESGRAVLLATHYDSVPAGPGAADAGASVAAMVEIARALAAGPPHRHPVVLLVDDGEEAGLLGAEAFAAEHPLARRIGAVVNLEARGTTGASFMFETSGENAWLVRLLASSLARPMASSLFYPVYARLPNDTDLTVFKRHGLPGVNFAFIGGQPRYHTPLDDVGHVDLASLQHQGQNALAIVRALADEDLDTPRTGSAVFFDVLGFGIVWWPRGLTLPLALLALLLVVASFVGLWRTGAASPWRILAGLVGSLLMVGLSAAAAWGLWRLLTRAGAWPGDATTRPATAVLAFWSLGLAFALLVAALFERWARRAGAWAGCWLLWALLACAAAWYVPEASYLLIVPALVAGVAGTVSVAARRDRAPGFLATALPLAAAAVIWLPPAWLLFDALGPPTLPVSGTAVALLVTALLPLVSGAGRLRWTAALAALAVAAGLSLVATKTPAFSGERPERMNVTFVQLDEEAGAQWVVSPQSGSLPAAMRRFAPFGTNLTFPFPWSTSATAFTAAAPRVDAPAPQAEVIERDPGDAARRVRLHVSSPRGARIVMLLLPRDRVNSVAVGGRVIPVRTPQEEARRGPPGPRSGFRSYACLTVPPEGVEFVVTLGGAEPVEGFLVDYTFGVPAGGGPLVRARPAEATAIQYGDLTILGRRVSL